MPSHDLDLRSQARRVAGTVLDPSRWQLAGLLLGVVVLLGVMVLAAVAGAPPLLRLVLLIPTLALVVGLSVGFARQRRTRRREAKGVRWKPPSDELAKRGWTYTRKASDDVFHELRGTIDGLPFRAAYVVSTPAKRTGPKSWWLELELPGRLPLLELRSRVNHRGMAAYTGTEVEPSSPTIADRYRVFTTAEAGSSYADRLLTDDVADVLDDAEPFDLDVDGAVVRCYARPVDGVRTVERIDERGSVLADLVDVLDPRLFRSYGFRRLDDTAFRDDDEDLPTLRDTSFPGLDEDATDDDRTDRTADA